MNTFDSHQRSAASSSVDSALAEIGQFEKDLAIAAGSGLSAKTETLSDTKHTWPFGVRVSLPGGSEYLLRIVKIK